MKKTYIKPAAKMIEVTPCHMVCESVSFGEGETGTMHSSGRYW